MNIGENIREILLLLEEQLPESIIWMSQFDEENNLFRMVDVLKDESWSSVHSGLELPLEDTFCYYLAKKGASPIVDDISKSVYNTLPVSKDFGVKSYVGAPLVVDGNSIGTICAASRDEAVFSQKNHDLLTRVSNLLTFELQRIKDGVGQSELHQKLLGQAEQDFTSQVASRTTFDKELKKAVEGKNVEGWILNIKLLNLDQIDKAWQERILKTIGKDAKDALEGRGIVARVEDNEFALLLQPSFLPGIFLKQFDACFANSKEWFEFDLEMDIEVHSLQETQAA